MIILRVTQVSYSCRNLIPDDKSPPTNSTKTSAFFSRKPFIQIGNLRDLTLRFHHPYTHSVTKVDWICQSNNRRCPLTCRTSTPACFLPPGIRQKTSPLPDKTISKAVFFSGPVFRSILPPLLGLDGKAGSLS